MKTLKWWTESRYIEEDSGQLLRKDQIDSKHYLVINKTNEYEKIEKYIKGCRVDINIRKIIFWCKENPQGRLFESY